MKTIFALLLFFSFAANAQEDTATYVLRGKIEYFRLLYTALKSPIDITPRQRDSILVRWVETIKSEEKKEEKPKIK